MFNYSWYAKKITAKSADNIHQTLAYGTINDIKTLKKTAGEDKLLKLFLKHPKKVYTTSSLNFITKFILHTKSIDEQKYLKSAPRST